MSPKRHASIALALVFVGFGVGFFGLGFSLLILLRDVPKYGQFLILMICGMIGFYIVKFIFSKVISAVCPKCQSKIYPQGTWEVPIIYRCSSCGHQEEFQMGLGGDA